MYRDFGRLGYHELEHQYHAIIIQLHSLLFVFLLDDCCYGICLLAHMVATGEDIVTMEV